MNFIVTAIVPQTLAADISTKLADVFDGKFIADTVAALTPGDIAGNSIYCFSGTFSESELATLTTLGLDLPSVIYWVQDGVSYEVIGSSKLDDIGTLEFPKQLIDGSGVVFHSVMENSEQPDPI